MNAHNHPIGAALPIGERECPTGEAGAPNLSTYTYEHVALDDYVNRTCPDCEDGEVEVLALDATLSETVECDRCDGTRLIAPHCDCGEPVTGGDLDGDGGVCHACELIFQRDPQDREPTDDELYASWDRVPPTPDGGWALAERSAWGMPK